ncbi:glycoside hydrolase family 47 protein [Cylindrobasidium torrendii FP15055 ss-10]|uniref:alpha-1,2-Mannosidase n=1 Tax=Cylindrobasidium torrendii FP15055 ss-10 TaxID=1314674 RepID=A0A0D7BVP8_9AGAR|nr:glycoside hydrolase family 47 protein [Cylindrobasidium torrendii FP15055 ss-10]
MEPRRNWQTLTVLFASIIIINVTLSSFAKTTDHLHQPGHGWTAERKLATRERIRELWYHGFNNYMEHAFPLDELMPLSCTGQGPDWVNQANIASNDVMGNFSLTLVDILDTFVVLGDKEGFDTAVRNVIDVVSFDVNTKPQVFETTIRVLGGLLSAHQFAIQPGKPFHLPWYKGELLDLAHDLGTRLLPAFSTPTGIPYARVNLRQGIMRGETIETCAAGAGSLMLEFATLSRLTGDDRFEKAAYKAFFALWVRKSDLGLIGNTINTWTGDWTNPAVTGIGAGIDSFYEYALKWYIMSGEAEFLDVWDESYASIMRYSRTADGFWYKPVHMKSGDTAYHTIDSLAAFWPGLQVLAGDIQNAIKLHGLYYNLWRRYSGLPEVFDTAFRTATSYQYPLRPELIESTWYLYRATKDSFYLDAGERMLTDIIKRSKVECGLCGIQDLRTNKRDDRMESFALAETLKYLYLIFDEDNFLHSDDSNYVFTTEGHILTLPTEHIRPVPAYRKTTRKVLNHQCPAYKPFQDLGLVRHMLGRLDVDYSRALVDIPASELEQMLWSPDGWCKRPRVDLFVSQAARLQAQAESVLTSSPQTYDYILSTGGKHTVEDPSPSLLKVLPVEGGFMMNNITGVRVHIVQRLDDSGYDIRRLGHYNVAPGQTVYVNDPNMFPDKASMEERDLDVLLRLHLDDVMPIMGSPDSADVFLVGYTAFFGGDVSRHIRKTLRLSHETSLPVFVPSDNTKGCEPYTGSFQDGVIITHRGECTFIQKLIMAKNAQAAAVIVISDEDIGINPRAEENEITDAGDLSDAVALVITREQGQALLDLVARAETEGLGQLKISLDAEGRTEKSPPVDRILHLNGHPLLNTKILV